MTKPFLLVDVDGVLNIFGWGSDHDEEPNERLEATFKVDGSTLHVPRGTGERMARLETLYNCIWATTWEQKAPKLLSPYFGFGLNWPVLNFKMVYQRDYGTWKLPTVRSWAIDYAMDRKLAWIDDDLDLDAYKWAADRPDTMLQRPDYDVGMTEDHVLKLEEFARG